MEHQILSDFLGSLSIVNYIVAFAFVLIALIAKWTYKKLDSVKNSPKTPSQFSWRYWWKDNIYPKLVSFVSNVISVFIILRFSSLLLVVIFKNLVGIFQPSSKNHLLGRYLFDIDTCSC